MDVHTRVCMDVATRMYMHGCTRLYNYKSVHGCMKVYIVIARVYMGPHDVYRCIMSSTRCLRYYDTE